jgi:excisionase family DNA binding protein
MSTRDEIQRHLPRGAAPTDGTGELAGLVVEALARNAGAVSRLCDLVAVESSRQPEPTMPPAYTPDSLAAAIGVSAKTIRNAIARGDLAAVKRGGRWLISVDAVDAWVRPAHQVSRPCRESQRLCNGSLADVFENLDQARRSA